MTTARLYLQQLIDEINAGPFTVAKVCYHAGINPSVVSRWKKNNIEPRLSSLERLSDAHRAMVAEKQISDQALQQ